MIYLTTYQALKAMTEERVSKSLSRINPIDSFVRRENDFGADVIEVTFGTGCEMPAIGA